MHEQLYRLDRSRRRWRAIALALALGHLVVLVGVYFLFSRVRLAEERALAVMAAERAARAVAAGNADLARAVVENSRATDLSRLKEREDRQIPLQRRLDFVRQAENPWAVRADFVESD